MSIGIRSLGNGHEEAWHTCDECGVKRGPVRVRDVHGREFHAYAQEVMIACGGGGTVSDQERGLVQICPQCLTRTREETNMSDTTTTNGTNHTDHAKIVPGRTKNLPVPLTEREKSKRGEVVAHLVQKILQAKDAKKNQAAQAKADIDVLEAELKQASAEINSGVVYRDVQIEERHIYRTNTYQEVRMDTKEVILERALTAEERQPELPGLDDDSPSPRNWTPDETDEPDEDDDGVVDDDYAAQVKADEAAREEPKLETEKKPKGRGGRRKPAATAEAE